LPGSDLGGDWIGQKKDKSGERETAAAWGFAEPFGSSAASSRPETVMQNPERTAADYRRRAAECLEIAAQMSLRANRELMVALAERWLKLADKLEGEAEKPSGWTDETRTAG
jgi:hypothetical protein